jgi:hypothetical protein
MAYEVLWLQVADSSAVLSVRGKRNKLEAAFSSIQFVLTLLTLATASFSIWLSRNDSIPKLVHINPAFFQIETWTNIAQTLAWKQKVKPLKTVFATSLLVIRSISELTIVVRYHLLAHPYARSTLPSRDLIYGLTTLSFLLLIPSSAREIDSAEAAETTDPLLANVKEDTRRTILREVQEYKRINGGKAPNMIDVLREVRNNFTGTLRPQTKTKVDMVTPAEGRELVRRWLVYVDSLETRYAGLEERDRSREF